MRCASPQQPQSLQYAKAALRGGFLAFGLRAALNTCKQAIATPATSGRVRPRFG